MVPQELFFEDFMVYVFFFGIIFESWNFSEVDVYCHRSHISVQDTRGQTEEAT